MVEEIDYMNEDQREWVHRVAQPYKCADLYRGANVATPIDGDILARIKVEIQHEDMLAANSLIKMLEKERADQEYIWGRLNYFYTREKGSR